MTVDALLGDLRQRGLRIAADGPNIRVRGPKSALTPEVLEAIRQQKPALLVLLAAKQEPLNHAPVTVEVTRRVKLFREQIDAWVASGRSVLPLLALPCVREPRVGACVSCGIAIQDGWRCGTCVAAVRVALDLTVEDADHG